MKIAPLALALLLPLAAPLQAQNVGGRVVIHSGPVSAAVVFGPRYEPLRPPYGPRVVVVGSQWYGEDYWSHRGYRRVTVWYDPERDCYYDRADPRYGFRPVVVYSRGGRFYREAEFNRGYRDQRYARRSDDGRGNREYGRDRYQHGNEQGHDHHDNGHRH